MTEKTKTTYVLMLEQLEISLKKNISEHVASSKVDECLSPLRDFINDVYQSDKEASLVSRLSHLIDSLKDELAKSPLNEDAQLAILTPLNEFLDDVAELAELDRVHQELSNKIIHPFENAHKRSNRFSISFGVVGLLSAIIGLGGFILTLNSQGTQQKLLEAQRQQTNSIKEHNSTEINQVRLVIEKSANTNKEDIISALSSDILSIKTMLSAQYQSKQLADAGAGAGAGAKPSQNPYEDYLIAIEKGDLQGAKRALKTMISIGIPPAIQLASAVGILTYGDIETSDIAKRIWYVHKGDFTIKQHKGILSAITHFAQKVDLELENTAFVEDVSQYIISNADSPEDKAFAYNQLGKIYYALDINKSKEFTLKALKFSPNDISYLHNMSLIYEQIGDLAQALHYTEQAFSHQNLDSPDADHISQYIDILMALIGSNDDPDSNHEYKARVQELYNILKEHNPRKAFLSIIRNDGLKAIIGQVH